MAETPPPQPRPLEATARELGRDRPAREPREPQPARSDPERLVLREEGRATFLPVAEVGWVEADGKGVQVHTRGRTHRLRESITQLEAKLDPRHFVRVPRSALAHLARVREVQAWFHGDFVFVLAGAAVSSHSPACAPPSLPFSWRRRALHESILREMNPWTICRHSNPGDDVRRPRRRVGSPRGRGETMHAVPASGAPRLQPLGAALAATLVCISLQSGCTHTLRHGAIPPVPAPTAPTVVPYRPALSVTIAGVVSGSGTVGMGGAYGPKQVAGGANEAVSLSESAQGGEHEKCGPTWVRSHARSEAQFKPVVDASRAQHGLSITAGAFARGGNYETRKMKLWCSGHHVTSASAAASAEGRMQFAYNPVPGVSDQLILSFNGIAPGAANLEIRGPGGATLAQKALPTGGVVVDVAQPGVYQLTARVRATAAGSDGCNEGSCVGSQQAAFHVGMQSLRDALALGFGTAGVPSNRFTAVAFISTEAMTAELQRTLFNDHGRFFPCRAPDCKAAGRDVYLYEPEVRVEGGAIVIDAKIGGHVWAAIFPIEVTGDLRLWGTPAADLHTFRINSIALETKSDNLIVSYVSKEYGDRAVQKLREKATFDITAQVDAAKQELGKMFPIKYQGGACLVLRLNDIRFEGMTVVDTPTPGVFAHVSIITEPGSPAECATPPPVALVVPGEREVLSARLGKLVSDLRRDTGLLTLAQPLSANIASLQRQADSLRSAAATAPTDGPLPQPAPMDGDQMRHLLRLHLGLEATPTSDAQRPTN